MAFSSRRVSDMQMLAPGNVKGYRGGPHQIIFVNRHFSSSATDHKKKTKSNPEDATLDNFLH